MPRPRRQIISNQVYEICFRARQGLPFACTEYMKLILGSILARVQRDNKVVLCHDIWNGSHPHIIVVAKDSDQFVKFYTEVQKKITDSIKRLLGLEHLEIWEGRPSVIRIADLDAAIERISYLYANPAQDSLVDSIEEYPGYSSFEDFISSQNTLLIESSRVYPWIRLPSISKLSTPALTRSQDLAFTQNLISANKSKSHTLVRHHNAWMKCFGIESTEQVAEVNQRIITRLKEREEEARLLRINDQKPLLGVKKLKSQPLMKNHKPKKKSRRIFIISTCKNLRIQAIKEFKYFCKLCRQCYREWKSGNFYIEWPPGAFKPPLRPSFNVLCL